MGGGGGGGIPNNLHCDYSINRNIQAADPIFILHTPMHLEKEALVAK